jgi:hypothetical protein
MPAFEMISAAQALNDVQMHGALLVNGYDDEQRWQETRVPGATSYMDFASHVDDVPKSSELIFYCA